MKKIIISTLLSLPFVISSQPALAGFWAKGKVIEIGSHDSSVNSFDYVTVENASAGNCPKTPEGYNILSIRSDSQGNRQLAQLIAAKISGRSVRASYIDTLKDPNGNCMLWRVLTY